MAKPSNFFKVKMARVMKIMLTDVPTLEKGAKIGDAAKLLAKSDTSCVVIVENNTPIGILTELDFVRNASSSGILKQPVTKIMSYPLTFMTPSMKLDEALKIIDTKKVILAIFGLATSFFLFYFSPFGRSFFG